MTDIKSLLERAESENGAVTDAPMTAIRRRTRRRRAAAVGATVAVVAAAIGLLVTLPGPGRASGVGPLTSPTTPIPNSASVPATSASAQPWSTGGLVRGIASGFGFVWQGRQGSFVAQTTPHNKLVHTFPVDPAVHDVMVGAGRVWIMSVQSGRAPEITAYQPDGSSPSSSRQWTVRVRGIQDNFAGCAFYDGALWLPSYTRNALVRLTPTDHGINLRSQHVPGGPSSLAVAGGGGLWVERQRAGLLSRVYFPGLAPYFALGPTVPWKQSLLGTAFHGSVWSNDGSTLVELYPANLRRGSSSTPQIAYGVEEDGHGVPFQLVQGGDGVFVATTRGVDFYSRTALDGGGYRPTAFYPDTSLGSRTLTPAGAGVLIDESTGVLISWNPSAARPAGS